MADLWPVLKPYYIELLKIGWDDGSDSIGVTLGAFDLDNPFVQQILKDLAKRVKGIDETTQERIQSVMGRTELSIDEKRDLLLEMAVTDSKSRAEAIARTESADAAERGNHLAWRASGQVDRKEWLLGPEPCPECQPLGGKIVGIDDDFGGGVMHPPLHPNCTCATAPILS